MPTFSQIRPLAIFGLFILSVSAFFGCESYEPYPRPYGFHRIDLPAVADRVYTQYSSKDCPFTFEYPSYAVPKQKHRDSCDVDIRFEDNQLDWFFTYRFDPAGNAQGRQYEDYRRLIYKHSKKATQITETPIQLGNAQGIMFEIYGNVGTPAQLFLYDSTQQHYLMVACYFETALKNDSLAPVIQYMKEELQHMAGSIDWEPQS
ncbi:hypothetical protein [Pontibacter sp. G13]|uniref:gliding motility lipoprotein GldD n=1 Tax=Pontibacter sp. G13 TaxID=3074898 RepID=UPI00288A21C6|nr:hypothetical protein [Pontibacter sp. G13]WNJ20821.1 hypothetical protein RJD25_10085 [Pontibacter sp. G13]